MQFALRVMISVTTLIVHSTGEHDSDNYASVSCDFQNDNLCGWTNLRDVGEDLTWTVGEYDSHDYDEYENNTNRYAHLDVSGQSQGANGTLTSPWLDPKPHHTCHLNFSYWITWSSRCKLSLIHQTESVLPTFTTVWESSEASTFGNKIHNTVECSQARFRIMFIGQRLGEDGCGNIYNEIDIDDIEFVVEPDPTTSSTTTTTTTTTTVPTTPAKHYTPVTTAGFSGPTDISSGTTIALKPDPTIASTTTTTSATTTTSTTTTTLTTSAEHYAPATTAGPSGTTNISFGTTIAKNNANKAGADDATGLDSAVIAGIAVAVVVLVVVAVILVVVVNRRKGGGGVKGQGRTASSFKGVRKKPAASKSRDAFTNSAYLTGDEYIPGAAVNIKGDNSGSDHMCWNVPRHVYENVNISHAPNAATTGNKATRGGAISKATAGPGYQLAKLPSPSRDSGQADHDLNNQKDLEGPALKGQSPSQDEDSRYNHLNARPVNSQDPSYNHLNARPVNSDDPSYNHLNALSVNSEDPSYNHLNARPVNSEDPSYNHLNARPVNSDDPSYNHLNARLVNSDDPSYNHLNARPVNSDEPSYNHLNARPVNSEEPRYNHLNARPVNSEDPSYNHLNARPVISEDPSYSHLNTRPVTSEDPSCSHLNTCPVTSEDPSYNHLNTRPVICEDPNYNHLNTRPMNITSAAPSAPSASTAGDPHYHTLEPYDQQCDDYDQHADAYDQHADAYTTIRNPPAPKGGGSAYTSIYEVVEDDDLQPSVSEDAYNHLGVNGGSAKTQVVHTDNQDTYNHLNAN